MVFKKSGVFIGFLLFFLLSPFALAHVGYVLEESELDASMGANTPFLLSALQDQFNVWLMLATIIIVILLYFFLKHNQMFLREAQYMKKEGLTYEQFIPWMARLSLGIALIGAGVAGVLISPSLAVSSLASLQILLGFLLFVGLLVGPAAIVTLLLFFYAFFQNGYMFGNLDFLGLCLVILALADGRPGIDDLLGLRFFFSLPSLKKYVYVVLRWSVGITMIFLAFYEKFLNPDMAALVVEKFALSAAIPVSAAMWVLSAGIIELFVGIAFLIGWRTRVVTAVAFIILSASFFYFNEAVFSHITLFAALSILFITGGSKRVSKG